MHMNNGVFMSQIYDYYRNWNSGSPTLHFFSLGNPLLWITSYQREWWLTQRSFSLKQSLNAQYTLLMWISKLQKTSSCAARTLHPVCRAAREDVCRCRPAVARWKRWGPPHSRLLVRVLFAFHKQRTRNIRCVIFQHRQSRHLRRTERLLKALLQEERELFTSRTVSVKPVSLIANIFVGI